jgi:hypothetical protein
VAVAELLAAPVLPRVGLGFVGWGVRGLGEPRTASCGPHPLFIALCDGGPPTMDWLGAPDQGARTSPLRPLGHNGREIELTSRRNIGGFHTVPDEPRRSILAGALRHQQRRERARL